MNTANEPEKMPDVIWICPSGEQTYSTDEGNSTPELKYIHSSRETALLACVRDLDKEIQRWQNNLSAGLADVLPNAKRPFKSEGQLKHAATIKLAKEAE